MSRLSLFFLSMIFLSAPSYAQEEYARGQLLSSYQGVGTFQTIDIGLQLSMEDGWYTYWRTPGDAGLAPVMDWSKSENVKDVQVSWPAPKRFPAFDMYSFGYDGTVILPLKIVPEKVGEPVTARLKLDIVVCHEICIPQTLNLEKSLPKGNAVKDKGRPLIQEAISSLPDKENNKYLSLETAVLGKDAITVVAYAKEGWKDAADLFIESPGIVITAKPEIIQDENGKAVIKVHGPAGVDLTSTLLGKTVTMVLTNNGRALEKDFSF